MVWRIAFPYARPAKEFKGAWVELAPSPHPGFREVMCEGERFKIPKEDVGPRILDRLEGKGCVGLLHQWGEGKEILDRRGGTVCGQGSSMQLALILSALCGPESSPDGPLVMISSAVDHPFGSPPFQGARAIPYAEASRLGSDLMDKYNTATQAGASALVLPTRDAQLLSRSLEENSSLDIPVKKITALRSDIKDLVLIGIEPDEIPALAKELGVPRERFEVMKSKSSLLGYTLPGTAFLILILSMFFWWSHLEENKQAEQELKRRRELISNIFANPGSIHRRLRDESLLEFLEIERGRREDESERIDLKEISLEGADLHKQDLSDINFLKANLKGANFNRSLLTRSYFKGADLSGSHLYRADLKHAVLPLSNLSDANLRQADLRHCVGLKSANLKGAQYDEHTLWPPEISDSILKEKGAVLKVSNDKPVFVWPGKEEKE